MSSNLDAAFGAADFMGASVYYVGQLLVAEGVISGGHGITGMVYHGKNGIISLFAEKISGGERGEESKAAKQWEEVKKSFFIFLPALCIGLTGVGLRALGLKMQGEAVHGVIEGLVNFGAKKEL